MYDFCEVPLKQRLCPSPDLFLPANRNVVVMAGAQEVILDHEVKSPLLRLAE